MSYMGSVTRYTGLSGIDTESMIKELMTAEKVPLNKMQQNLTKLEWQRDEYREITTAITGFKDTFFDILKKDNYMLTSGTYNQYEVESSDSNLIATAGSGAIPGSHILHVDQIATAAQVKSSVNVGIDVTKTFSQLGFNDQTITITANGNSKSFDITSGKTMQELMTEINSESALNVRISYSSFTQRFTLESKKTGDEPFNITTDDAIGSGGNFIELTGFDADANGTLDSITQGQKAIIDYDTVTNYNSASNSITIDGVVYDVSKVTTGTDININIEADPDASIDKIKKFVEEYNKMIDTINNKLQEKVYRDFLPLTDEQKKEMSEKDIELWEEKAKSGLLAGDSLLKKFTSDVRKILYNSVATVDGDRAIYNIGIETSKEYEDKGKLVIDEDKLKAALEDNPQLVQEIFMKDNGGTQDGVMLQLKEALEEAVRTTHDDDGKKGYFLERAGKVGDTSVLDNFMYDRIKEMNEKIINFQRLLNEKENNYYLKFSRLETMMQNANAQSGWLSQQFGGGM